MLNKTYSFLFLFYLTTLSLFSQEIKSDFDFVSIKEGISKVGIYSMTQDDYGFMWIGTNGSGLYKFDGVDYTSYKYIHGDSTSLSSNLVFTSYIGKNNKLWVGTEDGLNLYDRNLDHFIKIRIQVAEIDQTNISVLSINEDNNGNLLIGTRFYGLLKMNLETKNVERIRSAEINIPAINSIRISNKGSVYLGTSFGLREYDIYSDQVIIPKVSGNILRNDFNEPIQYILIDNKDNLWAGTYSQGVYKYQLNNTGISGLSKFPISKKRLLSLIQLPDNTFLVGSENDGLFHLNSDGRILKNYTDNKADENSISSNSIWSLFVDKDERVWMGYYNSGVVVSDKLYDKFNDIESSTSTTNTLQTGSVTGILKDENNRFWVSMDGGGIDIFDNQLSKVEHINTTNSTLYGGLTSDYIQSIFIDSNKNVIAGSWDNGIYILKKGDQKFSNINIQNSNGKLLSNAIVSIAEDKDGLIWIGTFYSGVYTFNIENNELKNLNSRLFKDFNIITSDVRKILVDSENTIWLGTTIGLFKITKGKENELSVRSFVKPMGQTYDNQKSTSHILSLYESKNGDIWIGTRGAGICKYDKKKNVFKWYNKDSELIEENIASIIEDNEGHIWISGNSGLSKLNESTNTITTFTTKDGLLSDNFNFNAVFKDNNSGTLYFGNYKGVDYFQPKDLSVNKTEPILYLTGFKIFNKEVLPSDKNSPLTKVITETSTLELNHKQSVFTIDYTAINYTRPEKNLYAYYLEGLEDSWNFVGNQRSATYTNLDYGDYTFMLKAANNDGIWNEEPLELKITILPPWWKTKWAIAAYSLSFLLCIYILNRIMQNRIKEKEVLKNERKLRVQEEELHQEKLQFFTNISHEFRTPLTLMISPLKNIIQDETLDLPDHVKEKHNTIYKNSDRLHRLVNELLDLRKLELNKVKVRARKINLHQFTDDIVSYFKEDAIHRNILVSLDSDMADLSIWADEKMLEKIIFNILSNAFKVTPQNGAINIELLSNTNSSIEIKDKNTSVETIEIVISDTGPGLKKKQVNRIFERFYQVDNINKSYYSGTGIGLEVVQNFVHLHKGKIEVQSEVGKGTSFRLIFPKGKKHFSKEEIVKKGHLMSTKEEKYTINHELSSEVDLDEEVTSLEIASKAYTLLIVEDNPELRNYLKNELQKTYKVITAINGKVGLKKAKATLPDVILTDVIMPNMNGFEFCEQIKSDIATSHIPLLMLTAKATIDDRIQGIGLGADAYMVKPFDLRLLKLRLSQLITSRKLIFDKYFSAISGAEENANVLSIDKEFVEKVLNYINENISNTNLGVESLASHLNISRSQLYRKIKTLTGQTVNEFLRNIRLQKGRQILESGSATVSEVSEKVGFSSHSYFTRCFKTYYNILPTDIEIK